MTETPMVYRTEGDNSMYAGADGFVVPVVTRAGAPRADRLQVLRRAPAAEPRRHRPRLRLPRLPGARNPAHRHHHDALADRRQVDDVPRTEREPGRQGAGIPGGARDPLHRRRADRMVGSENGAVSGSRSRPPAHRLPRPTRRCRMVPQLARACRTPRGDPCIAAFGA